MKAGHVCQHETVITYVRVLYICKVLMSCLFLFKLNFVSGNGLADSNAINVTYSIGSSYL